MIARLCFFVHWRRGCLQEFDKGCLGVWINGCGSLVLHIQPANHYVCKHHTLPDICEALRFLHFFVFAALRQASFHGKRTRTRSGPLLSASWPIFNSLFIRACRFQRRQATLGSTPSVGVATSVSGLLHVGNSQHRTNLHRRMALSRLWRFSLVPC